MYLDQRRKATAEGDTICQSNSVDYSTLVDLEFNDGLTLAQSLRNIDL
jgi:hypothetical protein